MGSASVDSRERAASRARPDRRGRRRWRWAAILVVGFAGAAIATVVSVTDPPREAVPSPAAPPAQPRDGAEPQEGIWLSHDDLMALPAAGPAWERLLEVADERLKDSQLGERDDHNIRTLAAALVGERLDDDDYRAKAVAGLETVVDEDPGDDLLAAARKLSTYVIAADVLDLATLDPAFDARFRAWLDEMRHHPFDERRFGSTIVDVHEGRPNNWGTHAGASRMAAAVYLGDTEDLDRAATVFRGYLGDRTAYDGFLYGDLDWQADPARPVGINPPGATLEGRLVDGVLPDDQRRGGSFRWPPPRENYVWEALQGAVVQAQILHRRGHDAWQWEHQALLRAMRWLHDQADYPAEGDDRWIPWLVNHAVGAGFPTEETSPGKAMAFTDWTHGAATGAGPTRALPQQ